ncbi:MAG: hypothetical protein U0R80_07115 [Nocardioidaceae bacterium]
MRTLWRAATALIVTSGLLAAGSGASGAADVSTPVYDGLPSGWTFDWVAHASPEFGSFGTVEHVEGDAAPGWGTGSLRLQMGPVSEDNVRVTRSLAGLTAASVWLRVGDVAVPPESFGVFVDVDGLSFSGPLPRNQAWTEVDLGTLPIAPVPGPGPSTTLLDVAAAHPATATLSFSVLNAFDAGGAQAFMDGWTWSAGGTTEELDLEGPHTPVACELVPERTTVVAGQVTHLTGTVRDGAGAGLAVPRLDLMAVAYGDTSAHRVMAPSTGPDGTVDMADERLKRTDYYLDLPQTATLGRCRSAVVTVRVRTKVSMQVADATIRRHGSIVASGDTTPAKRGTAVSLWRELPSGAVRLAQGTVRRGGTFSLSAKAESTGAWKVFVKVAGASGNLAGTSPTRTVRVS